MDLAWWELLQTSVDLVKVPFSNINHQHKEVMYSEDRKVLIRLLTHWPMSQPSNLEVATLWWWLMALRRMRLNLLSLRWKVSSYLAIDQVAWWWVSRMTSRRRRSVISWTTSKRVVTTNKMMVRPTLLLVTLTTTKMMMISEETNFSSLSTIIIFDYSATYQPRLA